MTFTVVALSEDGMNLGVATATCTLAVGSAVLAAAPGVGAIATQAYTNRRFRSHTLDSLRREAHPERVIAALRDDDPGFALRQVGIVDWQGRFALHTGADCTEWAGGVGRPGSVFIGNLLTSAAVIDAMVARYDELTGHPFAERLVEVLLAGEAAGGDRRGRQSAAVYVVSNAEADAWPPETVTDLRVDDHREPVTELRRLVDLHHRDLLGVPGSATPTWDGAGAAAPAESPSRE